MRLFKHPIHNAKLYLQAGSKKIYMEFYDETGRRRQISTKTENLEEAKDKLSERLTIIRLTKSGEIQLKDNRKITVEKIINEVLKRIENKEGFKGAIETKRHLELINQLIGQLDITKIDEFSLDPIYNKKMSKTKIANFNRAISLISSYATKKKYLTSPIEIPDAITKEPIKRVVYSIEELRNLFSFIEIETRNSRSEKTHLYGKLIVPFAGFLRRTGLRYGEALALKYSDIVDKKFTSNEKEIIVRSSKTAPRSINVSQKALMNIELARRAKTAFSIEINENDYIFSGFNNKCPDYTGFLKEIKRKYSEIFEKNGWSDFVLYSLRHDFIQRKVTEGSTVFDIATHCGTSVSMIQKYYTKDISLPASKIYSNDDYWEGEIN